MNFVSFKRPESREEVLKCITELMRKGESFSFCSGGTDLIPMLKSHDTQLENLISLSHIKEFQDIKQKREGKKTIFQIGSQITLAELGFHEFTRKYFPFLEPVIKKIASPQIRNRATLGGNLLLNNRCIFFNQSEQNRLFHGKCFKAGGEICPLIKNASRDKFPICRARFASDLAPIFLILNAKLTLESPEGKRKIPLREFYISDGIERNKMKAEEVLSFIEIEYTNDVPIYYEKMRIRNAIDFPSLGVGVQIANVPEGENIKIALTGINSSPFYGSHLFLSSDDYEKRVDEISNEIKKSVDILKQDFFSPSYRRKMIPVFIMRGIEKLKINQNQNQYQKQN